MLAGIVQTYTQYSAWAAIWNSENWFQMAAFAERSTRSTDGPLNLRPRPARLEVRRNFFSNRVVVSWNQIPSKVKNARNVGIIKRLYGT
jgi:hypothetical protein